MASVITTSGLSFDAIEPSEISKYVFESALFNGTLSVLHRIDTGIQAAEKIRLVGLPGLAGECITDCDAPSGTTLAMSEKEWSPKTIGFRLVHCSKDLTQQLIALKKRMARYPDEYDASGSPEFEVLANAADITTRKMLFRHAHFGDTAIAPVSSGGYLKNGVDVKYFNCINGVWQQIFAGVTANKITRVVVSENAGSDYLAQELAADATFNTLRAMLNKADARLKQNRTGLYFAVTRTFADNWLDTLEAKSLANAVNARETMDTQGVPGSEFLIGSYRGIPIYVMDEWDEIITGYFDNGTSYDKPNRAILTSVDNVPVGTPSEEMLGSMDSWYERKDKKIYLDGEANFDVKILEEYKIVVAY